MQLLVVYWCVVKHVLSDFVQFECEFRRFSVDRAKLKQFLEFHLLVKDLHCLPSDINFTISYTDPRNGDLLPINNDDNLMRAYTTAMPLLRLFIYREQGIKSIFIAFVNYLSCINFCEWDG